MTWYLPKEGELRYRRGFLFFPKTIKGETRWLERASWTQRYINCDTWGLWLNEEWGNKSSLLTTFTLP